VSVLGFDPVAAFNLLMDRLDRIANALEKIALEMQTQREEKKH
jgi:hypothetical protein